MEIVPGGREDPAGTTDGNENDGIGDCLLDSGVTGNDFFGTGSVDACIGRL